MGDRIRYAECHKIHAELGGKTDGCLEFCAESSIFTISCEACGCPKRFHRKVEIVYTKCHKMHTFGSHVSVDGCQEFTPGGGYGTPRHLTCAACGCHKSFHRNEVRNEKTCPEPI